MKHRAERPTRLAGCLALGIVLSAPIAAQTDDAGASPPDPVARAGALLARMAVALRTLDYAGTLVYLHEDRLETLHLVHRIDAGQVQERLLSLSGPVRAVSRESDRVLCALPDGHPIAIRRRDGGHLGRLADLDPSALAAHYRLALPGYARVAGRETEVIDILPRDDLRYGYRFALDRATALPLKSDLLDRSGRARAAHVHHA